VTVNDSDTYEEMIDELYETISVSNEFNEWEQNFISDMKDLRLKYRKVMLSLKQKEKLCDLYERV